MDSRSTAIFALVACAMACIGSSHAAPTRTLELNVQALNNGSCLTPNQTKTLKEAITGIQVTLQTAVIALDIASAAEKDPKTKEQLHEAAEDINDISRVLVANLTKIVQSACGTCDDIVRDVNETVVAIEQTMASIEPGWQNKTAFKAVKAALNLILGVAELICPSDTKQTLSAHLVLYAPNSSCLNASQLKDLQTAIADIQIVFKTTLIALEIAQRAETDPKTKADLQEAITIISSISDVLLANLTKILSEPCATCTQIVTIVNDAITTLEQTLAKIDPNWQKDPLWAEIVSAISSILGFIKVLCPSSSLPSVAAL